MQSFFRSGRPKLTKTLNVEPNFLSILKQSFYIDQRIEFPLYKSADLERNYMKSVQYRVIYGPYSDTFRAVRFHYETRKGVCLENDQYKECLLTRIQATIDEW